MTRLEELNLSGDHVDDDGMQHLRHLSRLERLYLGGTLVSKDGKRAIQEALPRLRICGRAALTD